MYKYCLLSNDHLKIILKKYCESDSQKVVSIESYLTFPFRLKQILHHKYLWLFSILLVHVLKISTIQRSVSFLNTYNRCIINIPDMFCKWNPRNCVVRKLIQRMLSDVIQNIWKEYLVKYLSFLIVQYELSLILK